MRALPVWLAPDLGVHYAAAEDMAWFRRIKKKLCSQVIDFYLEMRVSLGWQFDEAGRLHRIKLPKRYLVGYSLTAQDVADMPGAAGSKKELRLRFRP